MKAHLAKLFWIVALLLVVIGVIYAALPSHPDTAAQKAVAETRQALRQQGFKTDLADFDFSTSPELRAREAILKATVSNRLSEPFVNHPNLMETAGNDSVIVVWKQNSLKKQYPSWPDNSDELRWDEFREALKENQAALDAACETALSGPIRLNLNASAGNAMRLPHLALLKNLTQTFGSRTVLALHDGNKDAAWTNLMAATRLVTAWEPEPVEISHLVRFGDAKLVFNATWQALQTNGWPDAQLARLQQEWESANFFTNLPDIAAFKRASDVAFCEYDRHEFLESRPPFGRLVIEATQFPQSVWSEFYYRWSQGEYIRRGVYEDEKNLLLFYRDRELELRNAVQIPTWVQMRQLPGVTNTILYQSKYRSRTAAMLNLQTMARRFQRQGSSFLGRAAEAEAERRILITAIALERYRGKNGFYPKTLADLSPEFLKTVPVDFMDGQSLRYRFTDDGHFLLYSVGLDCMDDGGKVLEREDRMSELRQFRATGVAPKEDIVWPLPVTP